MGWSGSEQNVGRLGGGVDRHLSDCYDYKGNCGAKKKIWLKVRQKMTTWCVVWEVRSSYLKIFMTYVEYLPKLAISLQFLVVSSFTNKILSSISHGETYPTYLTISCFQLLLPQSNQPLFDFSMSHLLKIILETYYTYKNWSKIRGCSHYDVIKQWH